ncbi:18186_t:CDS:2 [Cetraspora pellucida]|uniref:18186_t:CDS:1 n=1 Tax=Cetraspora pellucida TaxID=1433469 RepID=A0ACA9LLV9_9GLOM|nr:18186_t:CDS:2 [Cetraspora pellucida]
MESDNKGLRLNIPKHVPNLVAKLIDRCLHAQTNKRPTSEEISNIVVMWNDEISKNGSTEFVKQIKMADEILNDFSSFHSEIHSEAVYMSRQFDPLNTKDINMQFNHLDNQGEQKNSESIIKIDPLSIDDVENINHNKIINKRSDEREDSKGVVALGLSII